MLDVVQSWPKPKGAKWSGWEKKLWRGTVEKLITETKYRHREDSLEPILAIFQRLGDLKVNPSNRVFNALLSAASEYGVRDNFII